MTTIEEMLRIEGGRVLATLIRLTGDITLAEDALQDAVLIALERWPVHGMPRNPAGWLTTTAKHRALDRLRREQQRPRRELDATAVAPGAGGPAAADPFEDILDDAIKDDQLRLLFTCCHPALSMDARVALALRTIAGLSTAEIARSFLVPEATIAQRISRAKRKIATARIPYRIPADHELPDRLPAVLAAVYLIFTTGHHAPVGSLDARVDLATEGVRIARVLEMLMPDEPECSGLLALTLATHARRLARLDAHGEVILLSDQDRSRWDRRAIDEAAAIIERSLRRRRPGPYQIQAAIACLHGLAPSFDQTDWAQIAELYVLLEQHSPSAVVRVNRAVAVAQTSGPADGLALLDTLEVAQVEGWHLYWSARAELLLRLGRRAEATSAFDKALSCECNDSDRRFLARRRTIAAEADGGAGFGSGSSS